MTLAHSDVIHQLVEMDAESSEYPSYDEAYATEEVQDAASDFDDAVATALDEVAERWPPKDDATGEDLFEAEGPYLVFMTLEGHGVGYWDGRWDEFYDDTDVFDEFLKKRLAGPFQKLRDAMQNAAYETGGGAEYDEEHAAEYAADRHKRVMNLLDWLRDNRPAEYQQLMFGAFPTIPGDAVDDPTDEWWSSESAIRLNEELMDLFLAHEEEEQTPNRRRNRLRRNQPMTQAEVRRHQRAQREHDEDWVRAYNAAKREGATEREARYYADESEGHTVPWYEYNRGRGRKRRRK
jgi:hypothetical protein